MTEDVYFCEACDETFSSEEHLVDHHQKEHVKNDEAAATEKTRVKQYVCLLCAKAFHLRHDLKRHHMIHTGNKPFNCELCDKTFTRKFTLNEHMRIHTGDRPFSCPMCNKSFTLKSNLTDHMRIHTGEKPYKCELCERCFAQKAHLNKHIKTHYGEKPFNCDVCNKPFSQRTSMNRHKEKFHSGVEVEGKNGRKKAPTKKEIKPHIPNNISFVKQEIKNDNDGTLIVCCDTVVGIKEEEEDPSYASISITETTTKKDVVEFVLSGECIKQELEEMDPLDTRAQFLLEHNISS